MKWNDLLFRVYDLRIKKMLYFDTSLDLRRNLNNIKNGIIRISNKKLINNKDWYSEPMIYLQREDKHNNSIFEEDIVYVDVDMDILESDTQIFIARIIDLKYVLQCSTDESHLLLLGAKYYNPIICDAWKESILEIIGNTYQNPELLK